MQQLWHQLSDKFSVLSQREKWLLTICGLVIIGLSLLVWMIEPVLKTNQSLSGQVSSSKLSVQRLEADILLATATLNKILIRR